MNTTTAPARGDAPLILAIDQGTTGTTASLYRLDSSGAEASTLVRLACANVEFTQHFPQPGWVEHDPDELWQSVVSAVAAALQSVPEAARRVVCLGITNQRETLLVWERRTLLPVGRALVWQDRRTSERCLALRESAEAALIRSTTGLVVDPYFSATKLEWLFRQYPELEQRAKHGELCFGTVDSYLVARLTQDPSRHAIEFTNASRTMLFDIGKGAWSQELCELFGVPSACLPEVLGSTETFGKTRGFEPLPDGVPITGIAGDQHAALFGQGAGALAEGKCTYGTGAFLLVTTGSRPAASSAHMLTTPAWKLRSGVTYALEGSAFVAGALVQWLRDGLGILATAADVEPLARAVDDSGGVVLVPALAGLGAPYWEPRARGMITGITRGTTRAHLARAALEAIAHEVTDLIEAVNRDLSAAGLPTLVKLRVDGGAVHNDLLLELQADLAGVRVERGRDVESTSRGAALLAAMGAGLLPEAEGAPFCFELERAFHPGPDRSRAQAERERYSSAVAACLQHAANP